MSNKKLTPNNQRSIEKNRNNIAFHLDEKNQQKQKRSNIIGSSNSWMCPRYVVWGRAIHGFRPEDS